MVSILEKEDFGYRILYSNTKHNATNGYTQCFISILYTDSFNTVCERNITSKISLEFKLYLSNKNSIKLNYRILADENKNELK